MATLYTFYWKEYAYLWETRQDNNLEMTHGQAVLGVSKLYEAIVSIPLPISNHKNVKHGRA